MPRPALVRSPRARGARAAPGAGRHPLRRAACGSRRRSPADARQLSLPPVSLAELFQNALKHNTAGPDLHCTSACASTMRCWSSRTTCGRDPRRRFDRDRPRESPGTLSYRDRAPCRVDRRGGSIRRAAAAGATWQPVLAAVTAACLQCLVPDLETLFLDAGGVLVFPELDPRQRNALTPMTSPYPLVRSKPQNQRPNSPSTRGFARARPPTRSACGCTWNWSSRTPASR